MSVDDEQRIVAYSKKYPFATPRAIKNFLNLNCSFRAIDRILNRHGLFGRVARNIHPKLDPKSDLRFVAVILSITGI